MPDAESAILESWPMLKEALISLLSDTDAWVIGELKKRCETKDWGRISKVTDVMDALHNLPHSH